MKLQEVVRKLREDALGLTQEEFAHRMGVTLRTIVRYENNLPPKGAPLARLSELAKENNRPDLAKAFEAAAAKESDRRVARKVDDVFSEIARWHDIGTTLENLISEAEEVQNHDLRERILNGLKLLAKLFYEQKLATSRSRR